MMISLKTTEVQFADSIEVDFQKNKKLLYGINAFSFVFFVLVYFVFDYVTRLINVNPTSDILFHFKAPGYLPISANIVFILGLLVILSVHELIHGLFFFIYTGDKPKIGFKSVYAYAAAPNWFINKKQFRIITLSPLVLITITGFIIMPFLPLGYSSMVFLLISVNAAGSGGDLWMSIMLMNKPEDTYVNDLGVSARICFNMVKPESEVNLIS